MKTEDEIRAAIRLLDLECRNPRIEEFEQRQLYRAVDALMWALGHDSWLADTLASLAKKRPPGSEGPR